MFASALNIKAGIAGTLLSPKPFEFGVHKI